MVIAVKVRLNPHWKHLATIPFCLWISLSSCAAAKPADPQVLHLLNRVSFGARPGDIERVTSLGVERYLQQQLNPASLTPSPRLTRQISALKTLQMTPVELFQEFNPRSTSAGQKPDDVQTRQMNQKKVRQVLQEAVQARLLRAVGSEAQLEEQMVDFWFNHFNVFSGKGLTRLWVGAYENQAIRPHALGKFRQLLGATARHPAMLFYLDNWQNTAPDSSMARGRFKGLNENYARELLELHTLGVKGGYTQQDVIALAKIFTGWGLSSPNRRQGNNNTSGFYFDARRHDFSDKVFLGQTIKGKGMDEGERVLDILAKHPATARHISYKLAQYFVADEPPPSLVELLSQRFLATDGEIRLVLETLFKSPQFWEGRHAGRKLKTPYQYVVSSLRALNVEVRDAVTIQAALQQLGMPLYGCPTPDGYKNTEAAWLNPDAVGRRLSLATGLAARERADTGQLMNTLGDSFSDHTRQVLTSSSPQLRTALILGSPEFMYR